MGEALLPFRKEVVIATKFGSNIENGKSTGLNSRPEHIRQVAEESLKQLKSERLEENLRSVDLDFTPEEWRDLNHAVSKIELQGDRYPTGQEKLVGH